MGNTIDRIVNVAGSVVDTINFTNNPDSLTTTKEKLKALAGRAFMASANRAQNSQALDSLLKSVEIFDERNAASLHDWNRKDNLRVEIPQYQDRIPYYFPFGMQMPSRTHQEDNYRYGYQAYEKDNEKKGTENNINFGARNYDAKIGRLLYIDPMASYFPDWSSYVFAGNNPIGFIDENGEFENNARGNFYKTMGNPAMKAIYATDVNANKYKALYMLAQYRIENSFNLTPPGNNPFNIKGQGDAGQITLPTTEYVKGKAVKMHQNFANFTSLETGFSGYLNLLESNFPNANAALTDNSKNIEDFANGLMNGKLGAYATDPAYATKLKNILNSIIRDYENNIISQIKQNNTEIIQNNAILQLGIIIREKKISAKQANDNLTVSNARLTSDLQKLREFKKNEKLDK